MDCTKAWFSRFVGISIVMALKRGGDVPTSVEWRLLTNGWFQVCTGPFHGILVAMSRSVTADGSENVLEGSHVLF